MKFRPRRAMNLAGRLGASLAQTIMATATVREYVEDPEWHPLMAGASKSFLVALWHEHLLVAGWTLGRYRSTYTLASGSEDGEIAAGIASAFGLKVLRGSSGQDGARALRRIVDAARGRTRFRLALTLDGPRGAAPRCQGRPRLHRISMSVARRVFGRRLPGPLAAWKLGPHANSSALPTGAAPLHDADCTAGKLFTRITRRLFPAC